jgi:hypothetical protein
MKAAILIFIALGLTSVFADEKPPSKSNQSNWWAYVNEVDKFTAKSPDGRLKLIVELRPLDDVKVKEVKTKGDGDVTQYYRKGRILPYLLRWPNSKMITRFDLSWDGKRVPIPKRFWNDIYEFTIDVSTVDEKTITGRAVYDYADFLHQLVQPRVILSEDGGTALITWQHGEECDRWSTVNGSSQRTEPS